MILIFLLIVLVGCQTSQQTIIGSCIPIKPDKAHSYSFQNTEWTIFDSTDIQGNSWNDSTLVFTSQAIEGEKRKINGYFKWYLADVFRGKEYFSGYYMTESSELMFQGSYIENRKSINPSLYKARLCGDGKTISLGTWSAPNTVPGKWSASLDK